MTSTVAAPLEERVSILETQTLRLEAQSQTMQQWVKMVDERNDAQDHKIDYLVVELRSVAGDVKIIGRELTDFKSAVAARFDAVGRRFDKMDQRLDATDQRVDSRFDKLESMIQTVLTRMSDK